VSNLEAEWLQSAQQGDDDAFAKLIEMYQTPVYNLCYRMLGEPQEAEDAAQETFWRAYQALKRYDPQRSFITWLLSIAAHYCIDQQRRRKLPALSIDLVSEEFIPDYVPDPEQSVSQMEQDRLLHQMLEGLNPQDRAVIILRYWYDFSEEEICQALSLTVSAVKSRLHRARRALAERWPTAQLESANSGRKPYETPAL
jgi:RNA polymerase sigma-70 factor (ECF subfamily)